MKDELELRGDKLRKALFVVWLANRYERNFSASDLARISGYKFASGMYGRPDWLVEQDGSIRLTSNGVKYVKRHHIRENTFNILLIYYVLIMLFIFLLQSYFYQYLNILIILDVTSITLGMIGISILIIFWYRINWFIMKRYHKE